MIWMMVLLACSGKGEEGPIDADGDSFTSDVDCDDDNAEVYPGAFEVCNGVDDDCNGEIDDNPLDPIIWHLDEDDDGYGHTVVTSAGCEAPAGYVQDGSDCDDEDPLVNPGADERCNDQDDNCNGSTDDDPVGAPTWYPDADLDGFGDPDGAVDACDSPAGHVADGTDCDDALDTVFPGAPEWCNEVDDDCDGSVDEDPEDGFVWYEDLDGDGYGNEREPLRDCGVIEGRTEVGGDCADDDSDVFPGAPELCGDGQVNDCAGSVVEAAALCGGWGDPVDADLSASLRLEAAEASRLGVTLAGGQDMDGDGLDDMLVGAFQQSSTDGRERAGAVHLLYGSPDGLIRRSDTLYGAQTDLELGSEVLLLPDLDGDGRAELVVAATVAAESSQGRVWILPGGPGAPGLDEALAVWEGEGEDLAGTEALASLGDVDGDGVADLLVGARYGSLGDTYAGQAYVLSGAARGEQPLSSASARLYASTGYGYAATRVASPGDLDGDGLNDAVVDGEGAVAAFIVMAPFSGDLDLASDADLRVLDSGGLSLSHMDGADLDGDGLADLVLSSTVESSLAERGGGVFLHLSPWTADVELESGAASILGERESGYLGGEVAILQDVEGDGRPDLLVGTGSSLIRSGSVSTLGGGGGVLVYRAIGARTGSWLESEADVVIESPDAGSGLGPDVASAGDIDGDGRTDLLLGGPGASLGGTGAAWVLRADIRY